MKSDPVRKKEENDKRNARNRRKTVERNAERVTKKELELRRKKLRVAKQRYVAKKKVAKDAQTDKNTMPVSTRSESIRRRANSKRIQRYRLMRRLENEVSSLRRSATKYRIRYHRLTSKLKGNSNSPKSLVERDLKLNREKVSPRVRRQLILGKSIAVDVGESLMKVTSRKEKKLSEHISLKYTKKYRLDNVAKNYFPFRSFCSYSVKRKSCAGTWKHAKLIRKYTQEFFEDDSISNFSPSKNDQIVRKKVRKQKRFITNSLIYLYEEYCKRSPFPHSYSSFCRLRPFWVLQRSFGSRDTCLCIKSRPPPLTGRTTVYLTT